MDKAELSLAPVVPAATAAPPEAMQEPAYAALTPGALARRLVVVNLTAAVLLALLLSLSLRAAYRVHQERAEDATSNIAASLAEGVRAEIHRLDIVLQSAVHAHARDKAQGLGRNGRLSQFVNDVDPRLPESDGLRVADATGTLRMGRDVDPAAGPNVADLPFFAQAMATRQLVVSEPWIARVNGKWVISVARGLHNADGSMAGVVYANLTAEHFVERFSAVEIGAAGAVSMRSETMRLVARRTPQPFSTTGLGTANVSRELREAISASPAGGSYVAATALDGVERANSFRRVPGYPLYVIAGVGTSEFMAPWRGQLIQSIVLACLLVGVLSAASWFIHGTWVRQTSAQWRAQRAAERNRALLMTGSDGIHVLARDGHLVEFNDAFAAMVGRDRPGLQGARITDWDVEYTPQQFELWLSTFKVGRTRRSTTRYRRPDGTVIEVEVTSAAIRLDGEDLIYCASRDMTASNALQRELARAREAAESGERFLRNITDSVPVRLAYVDRERRFRFVNKAHLERFGRARAHVLGRTRAELLGEEEPPALRARVDAVLAGQEQRFEFEEPVSGSLRRMESRLLPDLDDRGAAQGFFSVGIDITERSASERALRELTAILENTADLVLQTDWRGNLTFANPAARRLLHIDPDASLHGRTLSEFSTPETSRQIEQTIVPAAKADGIWVGDAAVALPDGRSVPVSNLVIAHRDEEGRVVRYSSVMRDISAQVASRRELQRQAETLRSVAQAMPAVVAVVGADGRYRFINEAFERWVGLPRERILGHTVREVIGPADQERSQPWIDRVLTGETVSFERMHAAQGKPSHLAVTYVPLWGEDGQVDGFVAALHDISQHRQEEGRLLRLSQVDALTGLLNRAGLEQELGQRVRDGHGASAAALYIDLDRFKPINDEHGHPIGDELLKGFAQRLRSLVRPTDAVARLGGDEFVVLLSGVREQANAEAVAAKIVEATRVPFNVGQLRLSVGASIGVAFGISDSLPPDERGHDLLARADAMLYRAKHGGRGAHAAEQR